MNLPLAFSSFLFFTGLVGFISWQRTRKLDNREANNYFLAGRKLPWIQVAGALLLTNLSTEQLLGLNGAASLHGAQVMAWEVIPVFALIAMAGWFLPRYWLGNITTVPEFLEQRFDRGTRLLMGAVMLITLVFNLLPFVLYSGGVAMSSVFHVPQLAGISEQSSFMLMAVLIALCGGIYVVFGGMKAVALSDTLYGVGLLLGGLLIPVLGLIKLGDGDFGAGLERVLAHQAPKLNPAGAPGSNVPFSTLFTGMMFINLFYWCTNQLIVQRSFGAASFAEAQKGVIATAALKLLGPFFLVFPGIIALEMFGAADIGNGDMAYARLVDAVLPGWMVGFFAAVLLGAIVSSFNGGLHSAATLFSFDLYRALLRRDADEQQMLRAGKIFAVVVCVLTVLACPLLGGAPEGVFTLMKRLMAAFKLPLLAVVMAGILSPRVPAWSAKTALIGGVGSHFLLEWLFGHGRAGVTIHWLHLSAINVVVLCAFMLIAGRYARVARAIVSTAGHGISATPVPSAAERMRTELKPWAGLRVASIAVAVAAIAFYLGLWLVARSR
ncbi:MAG: solute:sodium symporter family transporter [Opitutaceae bacterium]